MVNKCVGPVVCIRQWSTSDQRIKKFTTMPGDLFHELSFEEFLAAEVKQKRQVLTAIIIISAMLWLNVKFMKLTVG